MARGAWQPSSRRPSRAEPHIRWERTPAPAADDRHAGTGGVMSLLGVHHTGLVVKDLDRSIRFYHDLLGLEFYNEPTPWFSGPDLAKGVGVPGAELRQVTFWVGEHSTVELLEYRNPAQTAAGPVPNNRLGAAHVCFRVEDVWATKAELEAKGVEFYS